MAVKQGFLLARRKMPVMRHALVIIVRDEVENVLLQIRAGAGDEMHFVAADHLGQREAEFGGAHRARRGVIIMRPPSSRCAT